jgi:hypothetical protein
LSTRGKKKTTQNSNKPSLRRLQRERTQQHQRHATNVDEEEPEVIHIVVGEDSNRMNQLACYAISAMCGFVVLVAGLLVAFSFLTGA